VRLLSALCFASLALVSCTATSYEGQIFRRGQLAYQTGSLPPEWQRIRVEDANLAFKHRDGGAIICNAICGQSRIEDVPLDVLLNHALFGVEEKKEIEREELKLDSRGALRAHVVGTVDGAPIELELVVLKKDNCTFDFQLVASIDDFPARRGDFERFYKAFHKLPAEAR
jgi:hypothetical protein